MKCRYDFSFRLRDSKCLMVKSPVKPETPETLLMVTIGSGGFLSGFPLVASPPSAIASMLFLFAPSWRDLRARSSAALAAAAAAAVAAA